MKKTWTIRGQIRVVDHINPNYRDAPAQRDSIAEEQQVDVRLVPLADLELKVSARKEADNTSDFKSWGKTYTDRFGNFELIVEKDDVPHQVIVSTQFESGEMKVKASSQNNGWTGLMATEGLTDRSEINLSTVITNFELEERYETRWLDDAIPEFVLQEMYRENKSEREVSVIHALNGSFYFNQKTANHLIHERAWHWYTAKKCVDYFAELGHPYRKKFKVDLRNHVVVGEDSYGYKNAHLGTEDLFNTTVLFEEMSHVWYFQNSSGIIPVGTLTAIANGNGHDFQENPAHAFCEGFARYAMVHMMNELFGRDRQRFLSREELRRMGIVSTSEYKRNDVAISNALMMISTQGLAGYRFETDEDIIEGRGKVPANCLVPFRPLLNFEQILEVFHEHPEANYPNDWPVGNTNQGVFEFLIRAFHVYDHFTEEMYRAFVEVLDPAQSKEFSDYCDSRFGLDGYFAA